MDMRFASSNVRSMYRAGLLRAVAEEVYIYIYIYFRFVDPINSLKGWI
jgi:hypothetical protein